MEPHFVTVYQISADPEISSAVMNFAGIERMLIIAVVIMSLVLAIVAYMHWSKTQQNRRQSRPLLVILSGVFVCLIGSYALFANVLHKSVQPIQDANEAAIEAFRKGDYQTVEGAVSNFDPMGYSGHKDECFSVQDRRFCYSDNRVAPGFRHSSSRGGPIRAGLRVQIAYKNAGGHNTILQLKIAQE